MFFMEIDTSSTICGASGLLPIVKLIKYGIIPIFQIGIPIILIVLGMLDLGKAVMAGKEDEMKKAQSTLVKRAIYAVAVFFVVTLVTLVFNLVSGTAFQGTTDEGKPTSWFKSCWEVA